MGSVKRGGEMTMMMLGKPLDYWIELDTMPEGWDVESVIAENAKFRAKVHFYESKTREAAKFLDSSVFKEEK